ncbi:MAG: polyprenyl synthetase family protein [Actinomycetia bacterium]|nr:polyprenyl synthetase family protein [Actinomycetes bacterium]
MARARALVEPALRAAVNELDDERMRLIARYQLGWCDQHGNPTSSGGKAIRPTLAVLSAQAGGGQPDAGVPAAVAVELVHNFSLLHDDVMDRDLERRHRPTGWAAFGEGQAILAGNAMLTAAAQVLLGDGPAGARALPCLLDATQRLISGQSEDLVFERQAAITLDGVIRMEAGKTGALLSCAASIGALAVGAPAPVVEALASFGLDLGMAFQFVDDVLGITGDPEVTGKSASSDVRAGKRSAPVVAALSAGTEQSRQLAGLLAAGPPQTEEEVALAARLIVDAGGVDWATREADARLSAALAALDAVELPAEARDDLIAMGRFVVNRDY